MLTANFVANSQSVKLAGTWEGKTSQDYNMYIMVRIVNGSPMITWYIYEIKLEGPSNSQIKKFINYKRIKIIEDKFINSDKSVENSEEISGIFKGNTVKGRISVSWKEYSEKDIATANVTYSLLKVTDSIILPNNIFN